MPFKFNSCRYVVDAKKYAGKYEVPKGAPADLGRLCVRVAAADDLLATTASKSSSWCCVGVAAPKMMSIES